MSKAFSPPKRRGSQANSVMGSCSRRREDEGSENPGFYKRVDYSILLKMKLVNSLNFFIITFLLGRFSSLSES
ncbi:hypothetical protein RchiOBHm_Chr2g0123231 [Rosa chinensis]|uniref:Uncharacterized protein n=1 Tax=Rosa chinensis TaxID=74649 RepID=A0A2P6RT16_ROSCH|nr:hypothetical protein RchiOBHm_Chr2g0123231 [Rosa chinensis]